MRLPFYTDALIEDRHRDSIGVSGGILTQVDPVAPNIGTDGINHSLSVSGGSAEHLRLQWPSTYWRPLP